MIRTNVTYKIRIDFEMLTISTEYLCLTFEKEKKRASITLANCLFFMIKGVLHMNTSLEGD